MNEDREFCTIEQARELYQLGYLTAAAVSVRAALEAELLLLCRVYQCGRYGRKRWVPPMERLTALRNAKAISSDDISVALKVFKLAGEAAHGHPISEAELNETFGHFEAFLAKLPLTRKALPL